MVQFILSVLRADFYDELFILCQKYSQKACFTQSGIRISFLRCEYVMHSSTVAAKLICRTMIWIFNLASFHYRCGSSIFGVLQNFEKKKHLLDSHYVWGKNLIFFGILCDIMTYFLD